MADWLEAIQTYWWVLVLMAGLMLTITWLGIREAENEAADPGILPGGIIVIGWFTLVVLDVVIANPVQDEVVTLLLLLYTSALFAAAFWIRNKCFAFRGVAITVRGLSFPRTDFWLPIYSVLFLIILALKLRYLWKWGW